VSRPISTALVASRRAAQDEGVRRAVLFQRDHFHETPALIIACYRRRPLGPATGRRLLSSFPPGDAVRVAARASRISLLAEAASV